MNAISSPARFASDYIVAAEIEAIAWKLMEGDIEQGSDPMKLAADYADVATDTYEDQAGASFGDTAQNIVRMVRQSLLARIKLEMANRDWNYEMEYASRQRSGRIAPNGCGDTPTW